MVNSSNTVHCIIVPIEKTNIVLPNTVVAEIVMFSEPEPIHRSPAWLLGHITWQSWKVPVLDYASLIRLEIEERPTLPRIMIVKSLLHGDRQHDVGPRNGTTDKARNHGRNPASSRKTEDRGYSRT